MDLPARRVDACSHGHSGQLRCSEARPAWLTPYCPVLALAPEFGKAVLSRRSVLLLVVPCPPVPTERRRQGGETASRARPTTRTLALCGPLTVAAARHEPPPSDATAVPLGSRLWAQKSRPVAHFCGVTTYDRANETLTGPIRARPSRTAGATRWVATVLVRRPP